MAQCVKMALNYLAKLSRGENILLAQLLIVSLFGMCQRKSAGDPLKIHITMILFHTK